MKITDAGGNDLSVYEGDECPGGLVFSASGIAAGEDAQVTLSRASVRIVRDHLDAWLRDR